MSIYDVRTEDYEELSRRSIMALAEVGVEAVVTEGMRGVLTMPSLDPEVIVKVFRAINLARVSLGYLEVPAEVAIGGWRTIDDESYEKLRQLLGLDT